MTDPAELPDGGLAAAQIAVARAALQRIESAADDGPAGPAAVPAPPVTRAEMARVARSWTTDPESGRFNASAEFGRLCAVVEGLLRENAGSLAAGDREAVARLIMAQLAHVQHLAPAGAVLAAAGRPAPVPVPGSSGASGEQVLVDLSDLVTLLAETDPRVEGGPAGQAFRRLSADAGVA